MKRNLIKDSIKIWNMFTFKTHKGAQGATAKLLYYLYKHLEGIKTHARILFVDFSLAFNTVHTAQGKVK